MDSQECEPLILVTIAGADQLGVAAYLANRHARCPQLGDQLDPAEVVFRVAAVPGIVPANTEHQPVALVVAQRVPCQAGALGRLGDRQFRRRHGNQSGASSMLEVNRTRAAVRVAARVTRCHGQARPRSARTRWQTSVKSYARYLVPVIDEAPSWPESRIEELGTVTAPGGELVLVDFGCLRLWSGESEPTLDPGVVGEEVAATANSAVDLEILGDSPVAAGRATLLAAVAGRYVFDIPASRVDEMRDLVASRARQNGFSVRVEPIARMPHRTRVARLLDDSPDGAEVLFGGPWAVAVRGLPTGRPLRVRGVRMPEDGPERTRWHSIWVEADERLPARTEEIGYVLVDEARLAFAAPDALTAWRTDHPADGLVDLAFWGRDAPILIERTGAGSLNDGTHGWTDLTVQNAVDRASGLYRAKESEGLRFALDLRPHDDHYRLLSLARTASTESASVEIGGSVVCGFFTSWGDGAFPVRRDLADDGTLCRLRVEVGAPVSRSNMLHQIQQALPR